MVALKDLALEFLQISSDDLKASRVLYKGGLYAQAVYSLQQSVEKALKAVMILAGVAPQEEVALNNWLCQTAGHDDMKHLKRIVEEVLNRCGSKIGTVIFRNLLDSMIKEYYNEIDKIRGLNLEKRGDVEKLVNWLTGALSNSAITQKYEEAYRKIPSLIKGKMDNTIMLLNVQTFVSIVRLAALSLCLEKFEGISRYPNVKKADVRTKNIQGRLSANS